MCHLCTQAEQLKSNVAWQPSRDPSQGARPLQRVPPLVDMCVELLVDFVEDVESLAGLPDIIKVRTLGRLLDWAVVCTGEPCWCSGTCRLGIACVIQGSLFWHRALRSPARQWL